MARLSLLFLLAVDMARADWWRAEVAATQLCIPNAFAESNECFSIVSGSMAFGGTTTIAADSTFTGSVAQDSFKYACMMAKSSVGGMWNGAPARLKVLPPGTTDHIASDGFVSNGLSGFCHELKSGSPGYRPEILPLKELDVNLSFEDCTSQALASQVLAAASTLVVTNQTDGPLDYETTTAGSSLFSPCPRPDTGINQYTTQMMNAWALSQNINTCCFRVSSDDRRRHLSTSGAKKRNLLFGASPMCDVENQQLRAQVAQLQQDILTLQTGGIIVGGACDACPGLQG